MEELLVLKNCFDSKIDWLEKLFVLKPTWIKKNDLMKKKKLKKKIDSKFDWMDNLLVFKKILD